MDESSMSTLWSSGSRDYLVGVAGKNVRGWGGRLGNSVLVMTRLLHTWTQSSCGGLLKNCVRLSQSKVLLNGEVIPETLPLRGGCWWEGVTFIREYGLLVGWLFMLQWMSPPMCTWTALCNWTQWVVIRKKKKVGSAGEMDQLLRVLASLPKGLSLVPSSQIRISGFPTQITPEYIHKLKKKKDRDHFSL